MIYVTCPSCNKTVKAADSVKGRKVRCKDCAHTFVVGPDTISSAPPAAAPQAAAGAPAPGQPAPSAAARPQVSQDVLAGYRKTRKKKGGGLSGVKKRAHAVKLKMEVKKLRSALEAQWEKLAVLVLENQDVDLDVANELSELGQVQTDLEQKRNTLETLKGTKGSGSAVKDVRDEIAQLEARQAELMTAVGQKAEAARPDLPGASAHYTAIDSLRSSLDSKEAELAELEDELGPIMGQEDIAVWGKRAAIAAGAVVALILLYVVGAWAFSALFAKGLGGFDRYVPSDAAAVGYFNVAKLIDNELYRDLMDEAPKEAKAALKDAPVKPEDLDEVFIYLPRKAGPDDFVAVVRMKKDYDLEELVKDIQKANGPRRPRGFSSRRRDDSKKKEEEVETDKYKGIEYAKVRTPFGRKYVAKTEPNTFCIADGEDEIEDAIAQFSKDEKPELDETLKEMLDEVSGEDNYFAALGKAMDQREVEAVGLGFSLGSSLDVRVAAVCKKEKDAERFKKMYDRAMEDLDDMVKALPDKQRDVAEKAADMAKKFELEQSGTTLTGGGSWDVDDLKELIKDAVEMLPAMMMRGF